jgi:hypothetical protein
MKVKDTIWTYLSLLVLMLAVIIFSFIKGYSDESKPKEADLSGIMQLPRSEEVKACTTDWKPFYKHRDRLWCIDTRRVIKTQDGIVMAWVMMDATEGKYYDIIHNDQLVEKEFALMEVDCPQRKSREFMGVTYYKGNAMMLHYPDYLWRNLQQYEEDETLFTAFCK